MYEAHFHLDRSPFQLTPDPSFFFASSKHKRAIDCLKFGLSHGEGFVVVTGNVGSGKTTLIAHMLGSLHQARFVASTVVTTQVNSDDLLHLVAEGYGLDHNGMSKALLLTRLQQHFEELTARNAMPLIVVDEAQNLAPQVLEELRMLSNFRFGHKSRLLTVLVGQPQFRQTMGHPDLLQLRQRVVASYHLGPLGPEETPEYLRHRLTTAGWRGKPAIADEAYARVHAASGGVPRLINILFSRVLLHLYLEGRDKIMASDVDLVAQDMLSELEGWVGGEGGTARVAGSHA